MLGVRTLTYLLTATIKHATGLNTWFFSLLVEEVLDKLPAMGMWRGNFDRTVDTVAWGHGGEGGNSALQRGFCMMTR